MVVLLHNPNTVVSTNSTICTSINQTMVIASGKLRGRNMVVNISFTRIVFRYNTIIIVVGKPSMHVDIVDAFVVSSAIVVSEVYFFASITKNGSRAANTKRRL